MYLNCDDETLRINRGVLFYVIRDSLPRQTTSLYILALLQFSSLSRPIPGVTFEISFRDLRTSDSSPPFQ